MWAQYKLKQLPLRWQAIPKSVVQYTTEDTLSACTESKWVNRKILNKLSPSGCTWICVFTKSRQKIGSTLGHMFVLSLKVTQITSRFHSPSKHWKVVAILDRAMKPSLLCARIRTAREVRRTTPTTTLISFISCLSYCNKRLTDYPCPHVFLIFTNIISWECEIFSTLK